MAGRYVTERDVVWQRSEERDSLPDENGHARDDETVDEPSGEEPLDRDSAVDVEMVSAARGEVIRVSDLLP